MSNLLKNIVRFVLLMLVQLFVLNKVLIHHYVNPYIYLLFILLLPFNMSRPALLFCGLFCGLVLDNFMNTMGMHAAACVFIAYLRPFVINMLSPQGGYDATQKTPSLRTMGVSQFALYALIMVLLHHAVYFSLEVYDFGHPLYLAMKIMLSTLFSVVLIMLYEMLFYTKRR